MQVKNRNKNNIPSLYACYMVIKMQFNYTSTTVLPYQCNLGLISWFTWLLHLLCTVVLVTGGRVRDLSIKDI